MKLSIKYLFFILSFIIASALFFSCSSTKEVSKYESIKGKLIETGIASWYGPNFNGKQTANGETFDMYKLTAAHRTLPFGSIVKVVNKSNNKSVIVRINDRGPFAKRRIIDLSKRAAEKIGLIKTGTALVDLFLVNDIPIPKELKTPKYSVQIGSFIKIKDAQKLKSSINNSRITRAIVNGKIYYRVYVGFFDKIEKAKQLLKNLSNKGINGFVKQVGN